MEELDKNRIEAERKQLSNKELYELKKRERDNKRQKQDVQKKVRKTGRYIIYLLILAGIVLGIYFFSKNIKRLPPTTDQNHVELSPPAHIVTQPISDRIQRHMLEHADGGGRPGIIIQYNCDDYDCEENLIAKLTELVGQYPDNVYLAPNIYDGKIILTKLGKRSILDTFDEEAIKDFIGN